MAEGYQRRIDSIVDSMVDEKIEFNSKSAIQKDKEKTDMALGISKTIAGLNDVGQSLVLDELEELVRKGAVNIFDTSGNISLTEVTRFTATIVQTKVEEEARKGNFIRNDDPRKTNDSKNVIAEIVLTAATINIMIENYNDLSHEDKMKIIDSWSILTSDQRKQVLKKQYASIDNIKNATAEQKGTMKKALESAHDVESVKSAEEESLTEEEKAAMEELFVDEAYKDHDSAERARVDQLRADGYSEHDIYNLIQKDLVDTEHFVVKNIELISKQEQVDSEIYDEIYRAADKLNRAYSYTLKAARRGLAQGSIKKDNYRALIKNLRDAKKEFSFSSIIDTQLTDEQSLESENADKNATSLVNNDLIQTNTFQTETKQLPYFIREVMPQKSDGQAKEIIDIYKQLLESIKPNKLATLKEDDIEVTSTYIFSKLRRVGIDQEVADALSKVTFEGQLLNILGDEGKKKELLEQLDLSITQEIDSSKPIELTGELKQIVDGYIQSREQEQSQEPIPDEVAKKPLEERSEFLDDSAARESQQEQINGNKERQANTTEQEMFSFIGAEYVQKDSEEGLIPRNGAHSKSIQDEKKAVFYSHGKEGAIVMYFEFLRQYENLRGERGDKSIAEYEAYQAGTLELDENKLQALKNQIEQIDEVRAANSFEEYMGDKLYLKLSGLDVEKDKEEADEWRRAHSEKMEYNYANSWTFNKVPPENLEVMMLQDSTTKETKTSQLDMIKYFLSKTSVEAIEQLGVNDETLEYIKQFKEKHREEIETIGSTYTLVAQNIKEFAREQGIDERTVVEQATRGTSQEPMQEGETSVNEPDSSHFNTADVESKIGSIKSSEVKEQEALLAELVKDERQGNIEIDEQNVDGEEVEQ